MTCRTSRRSPLLHSIVSPVASGDASLVGVVVVLRDITEEKALEVRKEEFVSIASHELRTPLTSIGGAPELLAEQYDEGLTDKQGRYLQMARDSALKLNHIVDELLDVEKAERGRLPPPASSTSACSAPRPQSASLARSSADGSPSTSAPPVRCGSRRIA